MRARAIASFFCGLVLFGSVVAWAESPASRPPAGRLEQREAAPPAPVGHRQPQAKDVPPGEMRPADEATRDLDAALAKKLTICRGC